MMYELDVKLRQPHSIARQHVAQLLGGEKILQRAVVGDELSGMPIREEVVSEVLHRFDDARAFSLRYGPASFFTSVCERPTVEGDGTVLAAVRLLREDCSHT